MQTLRIPVFIAFCITAVCTALCAAEPLPKHEEKDLRTRAEEHILRELELVASCNFNETPLAEFVQYLRDELGVNVFLDLRSLDDFGVSKETKLTGRFERVSYRAVLDLLLDQYGMTWTVYGESLVITSPAKAAELRITRVYNVADLVAGGNGYLIDFDPLIELITLSIAEETWNELGGPGTIGEYENQGAFVLVISQTPQVHLQVERLLARLREERRLASRQHFTDQRFKAVETSPLLQDEAKSPAAPEANTEAAQGGPNEASPSPSTADEAEDGQSSPAGGKNSADSPASVFSPPDAPSLDFAARRAAVARSNQFSFDLFRAAANDREQNDLVSGYSVREVLGLASFGARGNTHEELAKTLNLPGSRLQTAAELLAIRPRVRDAASPDLTLRVINALWIDQNISLKEEFQTLAELFMDARVTPLDFRRAEATAEHINRWAADSTNGRIPAIVDAGDIESDMRCLLTNAIYFLGKWEAPFDPKRTKPAVFHLTPKHSIRVPTMQNQIHCRAGMVEESGLQIAELPYRGNRLSMVFLLPAKREGALEELEASLSAEDFAEWSDALKPSNVLVLLPKFTFAADYNLSRSLQSLGLKESFAPQRANFSGIADGPIWLQEVRQKTFIQVDEVGTEAAVITTAGALGGGDRVQEIKAFVADRPFLFILRDNETGLLLFVGRVADPRGT